MVGGGAAPVTPRVLAAPGALVDGVTIDLDDTEAHHLRVRRIAVGDEVTVLDGAGQFAAGTVIHRDGRVGVELSVVQMAPQPPATILVVGAGDRDRFLLLAERCTELGVTRLVPLYTARSRTVDTRVRGSVLDRARRRAREACKQSGNPWGTTISESCEFDALADAIRETRWLLADYTGGSCPAIGPDEEVAWVIGPEGGLTPEETDQCRATLGATPVNLGPAMLRFDTAALAAGVVTQDRRRHG